MKQFNCICKRQSEVPNGIIVYTSPKMSKYFEFNNRTNLKKMVKRRIFLDEIDYASTDGNAERTKLYLKSGEPPVYWKGYLKKFVATYHLSFVQIRTERAILLLDIYGLNNNGDLIYFSETGKPERVSKSFLAEFKKRFSRYLSA